MLDNVEVNTDITENFEIYPEEYSVIPLIVRLSREHMLKNFENNGGCEGGRSGGGDGA